MCITSFFFLTKMGSCCIYCSIFFFNLYFHYEIFPLLDGYFFSNFLFLAVSDLSCGTQDLR